MHVVFRYRSVSLCMSENWNIFTGTNSFKHAESKSELEFPLHRPKQTNCNFMFLVKRVSVIAVRARGAQGVQRMLYVKRHACRTVVDFCSCSVCELKTGNLWVQSRQIT